MELVWLQGRELHCVQPHTTSASQGWRAQASACSHQRCSQIRNSGASVYPNGHRSQESSLSTKEASKWHFPSWLWMCLDPFSWSGSGRGTAWCLSSLPIAQCTLQTKPTWSCPPNTTIPWVLPQVMLATSSKKPHNMSHELNYSKLTYTKPNK